MNAHLPSEVSRLRRYRAIADPIAADEWTLEHGFGKQWISSRRFDGTDVVICEITGHARRDEINLLAAALDTLTFFLPMFDRAAARTRELMAHVDRLEAELAAMKGDGHAPAAPAADRPKDYAAQASMLLVNPVFQRFLSEQRDGEVVDDKDTADAALKALLGIESKKQINAEDAARAAFLDLRARFSAFERGIGE